MDQKGERNKIIRSQNLLQGLFPDGLQVSHSPPSSTTWDWAFAKRAFERQFKSNSIIQIQYWWCLLPWGLTQSLPQLHPLFLLHSPSVHFPSLHSPPLPSHSLPSIPFPSLNYPFFSFTSLHLGTFCTKHRLGVHTPCSPPRAVPILMLSLDSLHSASLPALPPDPLPFLHLLDQQSPHTSHLWKPSHECFLSLVPQISASLCSPQGAVQTSLMKLVPHARVFHSNNECSRDYQFIVNIRTLSLRPIAPRRNEEITFPPTHP